MMNDSLHPATQSNEELARECALTRVKRSGPGGQRRNKVETGVLLRHVPTGVEAEATERRSQVENRRVALHRLRLKLAVQVRSVRDTSSTASPLWRSRLKEGRLSINLAHADFPALLAEGLDRLFSRELDVKSAASGLGCTPSQLVKLLKAEPEAFVLVNAERRSRGLRPLK